MKSPNLCSHFGGIETENPHFRQRNPLEVAALHILLAARTLLLADPNEMPLSVPEAQATLLEIVFDVERIDHQLHLIGERLPRSPEEDKMQSDLIAPDVATELVGAIAYSRHEYVEPLIGFLKDETKVTVGELRRAFEKSQKAEEGGGISVL